MGGEAEAEQQVPDQWVCKPVGDLALAFAWRPRSLQLRWTFESAQPVRFSVLFMKDFNENYRDDQVPLSALQAPQEYTNQVKRPDRALGCPSAPP